MIRRSMLLQCVFSVLVWAAGVSQTSAQTSLRNCDEDQARFVEEQVREADFLFATVGADLQVLNQGGESSSFDYWFGNHEPEQVERVTSKFLTMREQAFDAVYDCDCALSPEQLAMGSTEANTMAWVSGFDRDLVMHLCPLFFEKDPSEFGAGVLIHEHAHHAGALDIGQVCIEDPVTGHRPEWSEAARMLAVTNPYAAAFNADSYRLYAIDWDPARASSWSCDVVPMQ